jgi:uncharacterized protein (DUF58 family)
MVTARSVAFLVTALILYFFANQTQIGWLYVMAAVLAGVLLTAGLLNRGSLGHLVATRSVGQSPEADVFEADEATVSVRIRNDGRSPAAQVRATERCPLAAPDSPQASQPLFVPWLPRGEQVSLEYSVIVDRRGVHEFPPLRLSSGAPFGLFRRSGTLDAPARVLVYPELRPLKRLDLLDRQAAALVAHARPGIGTEFIGVRPFRSGDSPRHIHWRTVARTGSLISKEFADETSPGMALVLDVRQYPYPQARSKHTPFERAVKVAASIGDYALARGYPLTLVADEVALPVPPGPISRTALLEYLAKIQPEGQLSLKNMAERLRRSSHRFVAVVLPWPDTTTLEALASLHTAGREVLAVLLDAASFPGGGPDPGPFWNGLRGLRGMDARLLTFADDWAERLSDYRDVAPAAWR